MVSRRSFALGAVAATFARPALAAPDFGQWLQGVRSEAMAHGIGAGTLDRALAGVTPIPRVIELDRHQPETTVTFQDYLAHVVNAQRQSDGRARMSENADLLDAVTQRYGVDARFIVALWGIETDFGRFTGNFPVIPALATLAYDGRRPDFFRHELINALVIVDRDNIDPHRMMGSWAGAMGQSQFMPSSFLAYAVSFDGSGPPDIWTRRADVFASIANYLGRLGWREGGPWGEQVAVGPGVDTSQPRRPAAQWAAMGVRRVDGNAIATGAGDAGLVQPAGADGPSFLVYDNYRVLLKWNNSNFFAIAVGCLADALGHR